MRRAIDETNRRRQIQEAYNQAHGIEPQSIVKAVRDLTDRVAGMRVAAEGREAYRVEGKPAAPRLPRDEIARVIKELEKQMKEAAAALEFEKAAVLRDQVIELRRQMQEEDTRPEWEKIREQERLERRQRLGVQV